MSSDVAIAHFRFLERLLLVHGHWCYRRISSMICYFFYKNITFGLTLFLFEAYTTFSGQAAYNDWLMSFYNVFFTSLPVIALGVFDQDASARFCLKDIYEFDDPPTVQRWIFMSLGHKWRDLKVRLKKRRYDVHDSDAARIKDRDPRVDESQWRKLIAYWGTKEAKMLSKRNKVSRSKMDMLHSCGTKSTARYHDEEVDSSEGDEHEEEDSSGDEHEEVEEDSSEGEYEEEDEDSSGDGDSSEDE